MDKDPLDKAARSKLFTPGQPGTKDKTRQISDAEFSQNKQEPSKVFHEFYNQKSPKLGFLGSPAAGAPAQQGTAGQGGAGSPLPSSSEPIPRCEAEERRDIM